jgi:hypothetical protein
MMAAASASLMVLSAGHPHITPRPKIRGDLVRRVRFDVDYAR